MKKLKMQSVSAEKSLESSSVRKSLGEQIQQTPIVKQMPSKPKMEKEENEISDIMKQNEEIVRQVQNGKKMLQEMGNDASAEQAEKPKFRFSVVNSQSGSLEIDVV